MAALVPVNDPASVPVMAYTVPATVPVVNVTEAIPFVSVLLVPVEKLPPVPVFDQVTILPAVAFAPPLSELNCADMVTVVPAIGEDESDVTTYISAATGATRNTTARRSTKHIKKEIFFISDIPFVKTNENNFVPSFDKFY